MILTGPEIEARIQHGEIEVTPYDPRCLNEASLDLRLGPGVFTYDAENGGILDPTVNNEGRMGVIQEEILLHPGRLYLMHTLERLRADRLVAVIDGKSTLGRLGLSVHQTAGYVDPGYEGQYTLEVTCVLPIRLRVGQRIAQVRFHEVVGRVATYNGSYRGGRANGANPARPLKP